GIEAMREITENKAIHPHIVMVSNQGADEGMKKTDDKKIDALLYKPVSASLMFNTMMEVFGYEEYRTQLIADEGRVSVSGLEAIQGSRILLVEDYKANQEVAKELLERKGMLVDVAENGKEALSRLLKFPDVYDMVLMDIHMPVMDGYEATRSIRAANELKGLPVIAMTANAMVGDVERCKAVGMDDHIAKPIDVTHLYQVLVKWITPNKNTPGTVAALPKMTEPKMIDGEIPNTLPGISMKPALARLEGNKGLYRKLLINFHHAFFDATKIIQNAIKTGGSDKAIELVHGLKGLAGSIGAMGLMAAAIKLEESLRYSEGNGIPDELNHFNERLDVVLNGLQPLSEEEDVLSNEQQLAPEMLMGELDKLLAMLNGMDFKAQKQWQRLKTGLVQEDISQHLPALEDAIEHFEFSDASRLLSMIISNIKKDSRV
ncbi:response regulator, partial [Pseudomonadota bacterium]